MKEPGKRGRKPKVVVPATPEVTDTPEPFRNENEVARVKGEKKPVAKPAPVKEAEPKKSTAKTKVVVEKKPVVKPEPKKKPELKVAAKVESVLTSLLNKEPKKEVKKVVKKKSPAKKRLDEMAASAKISKPAKNKVAKVKPVVETSPAVPTEQS